VDEAERDEITSRLRDVMILLEDRLSAREHRPRSGDMGKQFRPSVQPARCPAMHVLIFSCS
jgi:hypothetical protein